MVGEFAARRIRRRREGETAPFLFTGVQLLDPGLFAETTMDAFSLNVIYDKALASGRLYGLVHDGEWLHVGTPDAVEEASRRIGGK